jgi:hypothetical protein
VSALVAISNGAGLNRVVLQEDEAGGVYAFAFEREDSSFPEWDYLLEGWAAAKDFCRERWGVDPSTWEPTNERPNS